MNSATLCVTFVLKKCREAENLRITDAVCFTRSALAYEYLDFLLVSRHFSETVRSVPTETLSSNCENFSGHNTFNDLSS